MRTRASVKWLSFLLAGALLAMALALVGGMISRASATTISAAERQAVQRASWETVDRVQSELQQGGTRRVIVLLDLKTVPEAKLPRPQAVAQRDRIARAQERLLAIPGLATARLQRRLLTLPIVSLEVDSAALAALAASNQVLAIEEDIPIPPVLAQSVPLIGAEDAWADGYAGAGQAVAILDTGVDKTHPFLAGKVIAEACFSTTGSGSTSTCPNGLDTQIGIGAGVPCDLAIDGCSHGTHVAGIAAGTNATFSGVARGASIIAIQVFSRFNDEATCGLGKAPCVLSWSSDQMAALDWLYQQRSAYTIASANLSLGGGEHTDYCDASYPSYKQSIDNLISANIATVIAAGNNGYTHAVSSPACISSAITTGATTKTDTVASFSNSDDTLDVWAPGVSIQSSVPGTTYEYWNGTSMAAPHVAGAWAVLKSFAPDATVAQVLTALTTTGVHITDTRNGVTKPRVQVDAALVALSSLLTPTATPTATDTPTETFTPTGTSTSTVTPTETPTPTATETLTPTATETVPPTATDTSTPTATATPTPTYTPGSPLAGDVNLDGWVNVIDVQLSVNVFLGTEPDTALASRSDLNSDGTVNVVDVQQIINIFLAG